MISTTDVHWAAGFMDGEGYFANFHSARVNAVQKDKWPLLKLQVMFGGKLRQEVRDRKRSDRLYWVWELHGDRAAAVMMTLFSLLSPRRQEQVEKAIARWKGQGAHNMGSFQRNQTHCKRGHEFTPENTYAKNGKWRQCRTCQKMNARAWYEKSLVSVRFDQL